MRRSAWALSLLFAAVAFAGCADSSGAPEADDGAFDDLDVSATEDTGVIRGVVVDATITPIAQANVTLEGADLHITTNEEGAFAFSNLEPGNYFVTADKVGFEATQSSVEVQAGVDRPPVLKIQLVADPSERPYVTTLQFDGFIACSVRGAIIGYALCASLGGFDDEYSTRYTLDRIPDWVQAEAVWESTQELGEEMSLSLTCLNGETGCPNGQYEIAQGEGPSPQIASFGREEAETYGRGDGEDLHVRLFAFGNSDTDVFDEPTVYGTYNSTLPQQVRDVTGEECPMWPVLFDGCMRATGVGLIVDQDFTVYTNVFYGFTPQEEWAFIRDGEHPAPE